jgi:hypothetical protein
VIVVTVVCDSAVSRIENGRMFKMECAERGSLLFEAVILSRFAFKNPARHS